VVSVRDVNIGLDRHATVCDAAAHMSGRLRPIAAALLLVGSLTGVPSIAPPVHAATVLTVPGNYPTIQAAVDAAQAGDTVLVSPGTYTERVSVDAKAITIQSVAGPETTIIDGNQDGHAVYLGGGPTGDPTFRGFTVRNAGDTGIITAYGAPLIEGNRIVDNLSCGGGSGIEAAFSGVTIRNNLIARNHQGGCSGGTGGGGIMVRGDGPVTIEGNTIEDNANVSGGGISLFGGGATVTGNVIRRNHADTQGGGIGVVNSTNTTITNNLIVDNTAAQGGGLSASVPSGSISFRVLDNTLVDNQAQEAAAIYSVGFNSGSRYANNIVVGPASQPTFECSTLYDPTPPLLESNDVYGGSGPGYSPGCGSPDGLDGNLSLDPKFVDAAAGDFHLRADSPLIDAGSDTGAPATDFDGDERPHDGDEDGVATVDIGFDEAVDPLLVVPPTLRFDGAPVGVAAPAIQTVLTNFGATQMTISAVSVTGADAGDFQVTSQSCTGAAIGAGASCTIAVRFTPTAIGERAATIVFSGPVPVGSRAIALSGAGIDPVNVTPDRLTFGAMPRGATSSPLGVTLADIGATTATVSTVSIDGSDAADFTIVSQDCTTGVVASGGICHVSVTFKPTSIGARNATLTISGPSPVGDRIVPLAGVGTIPPSGVIWSGTSYAGPAYTWNGSGALGRTVKSGAQHLHLAYATFRIGGKWATDKGPYAGIYYITSPSGATWTTPFRVNPTNQHAARVGLAASGSRVYVSWVTQTKVVKYSGTQPRVLYVRTNSNHGASASWKPAIRLTSTTGRVDYPTIFATGNDVYIAYTDSVTGAVRVATSRNAGTTWTTRTIGTATTTTSNGRTGVPAVSAYGATVVVVWLSDPTGTVKGRISIDHGTTWGPLTTIGTQSVGFASVAVRGARIAVAWATPDDVVVRQRIAGTWTAATTVASLVPLAPPVPYAPVVTLQDPSRVAVSWAEELANVNTSELRWVESTDGGANWFQTQTLAGSSATRAANDWASVLWPSPDVRLEVWNGWTPSSTSYRLYFRKGTGIAVGPTSKATSWIGPTTGPAVSSDEHDPVGPSVADPRGRALRPPPG